MRTISRKGDNQHKCSMQAIYPFLRQLEQLTQIE